jgi:hypothetical protein
MGDPTIRRAGDIKRPSSLFFPYSSPLLEEERHSTPTTLIAQ